MGFWGGAVYYRTGGVLIIHAVAFNFRSTCQRITVSRPMNCVARKMWGIHDAVRTHKARRHFRFSLSSIPSIPKRDL